MMSHNVRKKRFNLYLVAHQTRQMLLSFLMICVVTLFTWQLFLLNQIALNGYTLNQAGVEFATLAQENENLDSEMARLQTQEYASGISSKGTLVSRGTARFVYIRSQAHALVEGEARPTN